MSQCQPADTHCQVNDKTQDMARDMQASFSTCQYSDSVLSACQLVDTWRELWQHKIKGLARVGAWHGLCIS